MTDFFVAGEALPGSTISSLFEAIGQLGGLHEACRALGVTTQEMTLFVGGFFPTPRGVAERIETLTNGRVGRWEIRPDLWQQPVKVAEAEKPASNDHLAQFDQAFAEYVEAFNRAVADPRVRNFRSCVAAADRLVAVADA